MQLTYLSRWVGAVYNVFPTGDFQPHGNTASDASYCGQNTQGLPQQQQQLRLL